MAVVGSRGSYATDVLIDDYVGKAIDKVQDDAYRARAEQRLIAEKKKAEDEAKLKELEEYRGKFSVNISGNRGVDDLTTSIAAQSRDMAADLTRQIQQTTDFNKKADLMNKRQRLVQNFGILKQTPDILIAKAKEIADGVESGKYNPRSVDEFQKVMGQLETGKAHLYVDDNGNARVTIFDTDEQGNPTGILRKDLTIAELINGENPIVASKYDANQGIAEQFVTTVKQDKEEIQRGYVTEGRTGDFTGRIKMLAEAKGRELSENPSEAYELWIRMGNSPKRNFSQDDKNAIAEYVATDLQNRYGKEETRKVDLSAMRQDEELKYKKARDKKADEKEEVVPTVVPTNNIKFIEDIYKGEKGGGVKIDASNILPNSLLLDKPISIDNVGGEKGLSNINLKSVSLDRDGRLVFTATVKNDSGSSTKSGDTTVKLPASYSQVTRKASGQTEALIAKKLKYESVDALKKYLRDIQGEQLEQPDSNVPSAQINTSKYNK